MRRTVAVTTTLVATTLLSAQTAVGQARVCQNFTIEPSAQIRACTRLVSLPYTQWQVLMLRAAAYLRANQVENAKQDYASALRFAMTIQTFTPLCWTYAVLNFEQEYPDCIDPAQMPTDGPALNTRGFVFLRMGRFEEAVADYNRALKQPLSESIAYGFVDSRTHYALFGRGIAKLRLGDTEGATPTFPPPRRCVRG